MSDLPFDVLLWWSIVGIHLVISHIVRAGKILTHLTDVAVPRQARIVANRKLVVDKA